VTPLSEPAGGDSRNQDTENWPMFRLNLPHNSSRGAVGLEGSPQLRWKFDTGGTVESSPAVAAGIVYQGTFAQNLFALEAATGNELWRFPVGGLLRASPAVVDGIVYFGADDNRFYAVDAKSGQERWSFGLGPGGEQSSPAIVAGTVYFGAFDRNIYALDAITGRGTVALSNRRGHSLFTCRGRRYGFHRVD
jgi:outer membrane protein assembly factor BamB